MACSNVAVISMNGVTVAEHLVKGTLSRLGNAAFVMHVVCDVVIQLFNADSNQIKSMTDRVPECIMQ